MYAIVDIETTGGYAAANDITEIAIVIHDGTQVVEVYESLIKPSVSIPYFIQSLTGINHQMVERAPEFREVAQVIFEKLQGKVFVAHNVNFDFSFLKHHLSLYGFDLQAQKLCTVRLTRRVFPELPSYSLGNICRHFNILLENRHRAGEMPRQQPAFSITFSGTTARFTSISSLEKIQKSNASRPIFQGISLINCLIHPEYIISTITREK